MLSSRVVLQVAISLTLLLITMNQAMGAQDGDLQFLNVKTRIETDENLKTDDSAPPKQVDLPFQVNIVRKSDVDKDDSKRADGKTSTTTTTMASTLLSLSEEQVRATQESKSNKTHSGSQELQLPTSLISALLLTSGVAMYLFCKGSVFHL